MDIARVRNFHVSGRSLALIVPVVTLLAASVFWNLRQHRLIEQKYIADQQEEAARAKAETARAATRAKKNAEWAASDARVQQLYQEISNFSQINDRLLSQPQQSMPRTRDNVSEADGSP